MPVTTRQRKRTLVNCDDENVSMDQNVKKTKLEGKMTKAMESLTLHSSNGAIGTQDVLPSSGISHLDIMPGKSAETIQIKSGSLPLQENTRYNNNVDANILLEPSKGNNRKTSVKHLVPESEDDDDSGGFKVILKYNPLINTAEITVSSGLNQSTFGQNFLNEMNAKYEMYRPDPNYLSLQTKPNPKQNVTPKMRAILFDWLIEVCQEYQLQRQTLYIALNFVDRFLFKRESNCNVLQLIGVTALMLAAKIEEIYPPSVEMFSKSTANTFDEETILSLEIVMMRVLEWNFNPPTLNDWLSYFVYNISENYSSFDTELSDMTALKVLKAARVTLEKSSRKPLKRQVFDCFDYPKSTFKTNLFMNAMDLMDMCAIDYTSLQYPHGLLAALVLSQFLPSKGKELVLNMAGYCDMKSPLILEVDHWLSSRVKFFVRNSLPHSKWQDIVGKTYVVDWHTLQLHNQCTLNGVKSIQQYEMNLSEGREE